MTAPRQSLSEIRRIADAVRERDGFRCVHCGVTNDQYKAVYGRQLDVRRRRPGSAYTVAGCETARRACNVRLSKRKGGRPGGLTSSRPPSKPALGSPKRKYDRGTKK